MNSKTIGFILIGVAVVIGILVTVVLFSSEPEPKVEPVYLIDFTYYDIENIQNSLRTDDIIVTTPTAITDHTIGQYCTYFDDNDTQKFVEYCTTTAIIDSDGNSIGNINIGGTFDESTMALALIESGTIDSRTSEISKVFTTMIQTLVCNCWDDLQPGGFGSVDDWINTTTQKYSESGKTTIESKIDGLDSKQLILEITSDEHSYLWTLIVVK